MIRVTDASEDDLGLVDGAISVAERALVAERYTYNCRELLRLSLKNSEVACTIWNNHDPLLLFGVERASLATRDGYLWMIGTRHIKKCPIAFARATKRIVAQLMLRYDRLTNVLDCNDPAALKWAIWCGAKVIEGERYAPFEVSRG